MMGKTSNICLWREGGTTQDDQQHTFMERGGNYTRSPAAYVYGERGNYTRSPATYVDGEREELHKMTSNICLWREGGTTQDNQQHTFMERGGTTLDDQQHTFMERGGNYTR